MIFYAYMKARGKVMLIWNVTGMWLILCSSSQFQQRQVNERERLVMDYMRVTQLQIIHTPLDGSAN